MIYTLNNKNSKIEFMATAPFHKFKGWSKKGFEGKLDIDFENNIINDINIVIKTEYFETGDRLKNKEMQKYIKSNLIPDSSFKLLNFKKMNQTSSSSNKTSYNILVDGLLSFMDIKREIELNIHAYKMDEYLFADVTFDWSFKNYGLKPPQILFIKVKDIVKISAHLEFIEE
jgi:polyisoprenoid-binding protein YceI